MNTLKNTVFVLLLSLAMIGCTREHITNVTPALNETLSLPSSGSARVGQSLTVQVTSIDESRCPSNAICVRYGNVKVAVALSTGTSSQSGTLCLGDCGGQTLRNRDTTNIQLEHNQYKVILTEVKPYPGNAPATTKQTAELIVVK